MLDLTLPPSVTIGPTSIAVSLFAENGAIVQVSLPRPRGLGELSSDEVSARARRLAKAALVRAAEAL